MVDSGTYEGQKFGESPNHNDGLGPLPEELQAGLRRGYYASVSFMDHEVGRVLDELDTMGFASNTAVLFHADRASQPVLSMFYGPKRHNVASLQVLLTRVLCFYTAVRGWVSIP